MDLYLGIAVVVATLMGPVLAVMVTRRIDDARAQKATSALVCTQTEL
jgi:hypothetical protein